MGTVVSVTFGERDRTWPTRIEVVEHAQVVLVAPTRPMGPPILPAPGTGVRFTWPTDLGLVHGLGELQRTAQDVVALWEVGVARLVREQRRDAFRLPVALRVVLRAGQGPIDARTRDVSENGMSCVVDGVRAPQVGDVVEVTLVLPTGGPIAAPARVVRVEPVDPASPSVGELWLGLGFVEPDHARTEVLRQFVLSEQLTGRRGRLRVVR